MITLSHWPRLPRAASPIAVMKNDRSRTLVYSTDPAVRLAAQTPAPEPEIRPSGPTTVRLSYETKGRKGKGATLLRDAPLTQAELMLLGKTLRQACGSGGTVKDGVIEIQGDHRERITAALQARQWIIKRVGG